MSNKKSSSSLGTKVTRAYCNTRAKEIKIIYTWTIDNFSSIYKTMGDEYKSSTFFSDDYDQLKWYLKIKPNGCVYDEDSKDYVSLYLCKKQGHNLDVDVSFKLALLNDKAEEDNIVKLNHLFKNDEVGYGSPKFVGHYFLLDKSNGLLPDNKLKILCEITYVTGISNVSGQSSSVPVKVLDSKLGDDFIKLFDNSELSDVTLVAYDQEFKAHKAILAARSDVFAAMFKHNLEEAKTNRVVINDIGHEVLKEMLHFIYTDEASNLNEMARDLLVAADKYALDKLKGMCEEALYVNLSIETAMETLIFADQHNADHLKACTKTFIHTHIKDVMETQSWKEFIQKSTLTL